MPDKLPRGVKLMALEMDAKGQDQREIAKALGISVHTITKAKRNMKATGDVETVEKKKGPKSKMDPGMQEVIFALSYLLIDVGTYCVYSTPTRGGLEPLR
jgi:DNA-binding Lrp family transcriptional regulator